MVSEILEKSGFFPDFLICGYTGEGEKMCHNGFIPLGIEN